MPCVVEARAEFRKEVEIYPKVPNPFTVEIRDAEEIYPNKPRPAVVEVRDGVDT